MKNIIKIILFNIIFIFVFLIILDFSFVYYKNNSYIIKNKFRLLPHLEAKYSEHSRDGINSPVRPMNKSDKRPLAISGCSIAFGAFLPLEQTIGYLLSQLTDRTVYNRGSSSTCISHVLYELTKTNFYDDMENPEYLFFIYDPVLHSNRTNAFVFNPTSQIEYLRYKSDNNSLKIATGKAIPFISALSIYRHFSYFYNLKNSYSDYNKALTISLFKEVKKEIQTKFSDIKFIVILYEGNMSSDDYNNQFIIDVLQSLNNEGIEVVSVNEMIEDDSSNWKYKSDSVHPNSIVWDKVSKKLVERFGL